MRTGILTLLTKETLDAKLASMDLAQNDISLNAQRVQETLFDVIYAGVINTKAWETVSGEPSGSSMGHSKEWKKFVEENALVSRSGKTAPTIDVIAKLCHPSLDTWVNEFDAVEQSFHQRQLGQNMLQNMWPAVWKEAGEKAKVGSEVDKEKRNDFAKSRFDALHLLTSENGGAVSDEKLSEFAVAWQETIDVDDLKVAKNKFEFLRLSMSSEQKEKTDKKAEVLGRLKKLTALEKGIDNVDKIKFEDVQKVFTGIEVDAKKFRDLKAVVGADEKTSVADVVSGMKAKSQKYIDIATQFALSVDISGIADDKIDETIAYLEAGRKNLVAQAEELGNQIATLQNRLAQADQIESVKKSLLSMGIDEQTAKVLALQSLSNPAVQKMLENGNGGEKNVGRGKKPKQDADSADAK